MNVKLIKLTKEYEKELGEMLDEWNDENSVPADYLEKLKNIMKSAK